MSEPRWLGVAVALQAHAELLAEHGGAAGLRASDLLESALARPRKLFAYGQGVGLPRLAAAYAYGLVKNHAFVDGNKRVAASIMGGFLLRNGLWLDVAERELEQVIQRLAAGNLNEGELAVWLEANTAPADLS